MPQDNFITEMVRSFIFWPSFGIVCTLVWLRKLLQKRLMELSNFLNNTAL